MNPYYRTLELEQGADKQTIKKAYFKMIRKFPPDKNPVEFKKVREAYEYLQKEENLQQLENVVDVPPEFEKPYYQALQYHQEHRIDNAIALCESVLKIAELEPFQILLATYYNENKNYGKAAALWEKLTQAQKNNPKFLTGLMTSYQGRNWVQKAIRIGAQLEELEYCDLTYFSTYAKLWITRQDYRPLQTITARAMELYESAEKHTQQEAEELCQIIECLLQRELECRLSVLVKDAQKAAETMKKGIEEPACSKIFAKFALRFYGLFVDQIKNYSKSFVILSLFQPLVQAGTLFYDEDEMIYCLSSQCKAEFMVIQQDEEIETLFKNNVSLWLKKYMFFYVQEKKKVDLGTPIVGEEELYDILLYWTSRFDKILPSLRKVTESYPNLAKAMSPYLEELLSEDTLTLRKKYEKHYKKLMGYPASAELVLDQDHEYQKNSPYKRETKKVGRNDPCPCGSGKKYKQCCGRNQ